jgi:hypothetical protein
MNEELRMKNEETNPARNSAPLLNYPFFIVHSSFPQP